VSAGPGGTARYEPGEDSDGIHPMASFRRWRNTRPFWGALFVILSGAVILLSEKAPVAVVIHIGLQGLAGYLIPAILLLCGLLLLINPLQRTFYSLLAILLALGSWITSNLGGFFVGMALGLIGGALAFAWEQREGPQHEGGMGRGHKTGPPSWLRQRDEQSQGLSLLVGEQGDDAAESDVPTQPDLPRPTWQDERPADESWRRGDATGYRAMAVCAAVVGLLAVPGSLPVHLASAAVRGAKASGSPSPKASASPSPGASASPSPKASASPSPTPSPSPSPSASPSPSPTPSASPSPSASKKPRKTRKKARVARASSQPAATARSHLSASSAMLSGASFEGVADVSTADGTVPMLKFAMSSLTLSGTTIKIVVSGVTVSASAASLGFSGDVVLLTTKISGYLHGTRVTYTAKRPPSSVPRDATFTDMVTGQPYLTAASLESQALGIAIAQGA
jgi:hypothetical protein